jgi:hypothetical protein
MKFTLAMESMYGHPEDGTSPDGNSKTEQADSSSLRNTPTDIVDDTVDIADDRASQSNPEQYLEEAEEILSNLDDLLPTLLDPSEDMQQDLPATDLALFDQTDRQTAAVFFPKAPTYMVERLVTANRRRRIVIHYLRKDAASSESAVPGPAALAAKPPISTNKGLSSLRVRGYRKRPVPSSSDMGALSTTGTSATMGTSARNPSIFSKHYGQPSVGTSIDSYPNPIQDIEPPKPPVDPKTDGSFPIPFQCPYCCFDVPLQPDVSKMEKEDWINHFYLDLQPYTCTFEDCSRAHKVFGIKQEWLQHELDFHRAQQVWFCAKAECRQEFRARGKFEEHLMTIHQELIDKADLSTIVDTCQRPSLVAQPIQQDCTLCGKPYQSPTEWKEHIGSHLEQFALTSLGEDLAAAEDEIENEDMSAASNDQRSIVLNFVKEQTVRYESVHGNTVIPKPTKSEGQYTDSSNVLGEADPKMGKESPDSWEKVHDYLVKDKEPDGFQVFDIRDGQETVRLNFSPRNKDFVGREDDLQILHRHISQGGHICVMSGRGGIGKTATAMEYSHIYEGEYDFIFWVEAETAGGLADRYNLIGNQVFSIGGDGEDPTALSVTIRDKLARWEKRWLLIFDNVEDWKDIVRYVPRHLAKTRGSVLVTTRQEALIKSDVSTLHRLRLEPLSLEESTEFLLCSIDPKLERHMIKSHQDYQTAVMASERVERLPLAVIMIAGYVRVSKASLEEFLEIWEEKEKFRSKRKSRSKLITEGTLDASIDLLWDIGISELSVPARTLLEIFAFLASDDIPQDLLVGDHTEEYLEFLNSTETSLYVHLPFNIKLSNKGLAAFPLFS